MPDGDSSNRDEFIRQAQNLGRDAAQLGSEGLAAVSSALAPDTQTETTPQTGAVPPEEITINLRSEDLDREEICRQIRAAFDSGNKDGLVAFARSTGTDWHPDTALSYYRASADGSISAEQNFLARLMGEDIRTRSNNGEIDWMTILSNPNGLEDYIRESYPMAVGEDGQLMPFVQSILSWVKDNILPHISGIASQFGISLEQNRAASGSDAGNDDGTSTDNDQNNPDGPSGNDGSDVVLTS